MEEQVPPIAIVRGAFDLRRLAGDAGLVIGSALAANVINYVFHFTISRRLGPDDYGTLTAFLAIAVMIGVIGSSLNTVALQETARLWVSHRDDQIGEFVRHTAAPVFGIAALIGLCLLASSLILGPYLHITGWQLWSAFALYCAIATVATFWRGCAQGAHRFQIFATSLVGESVVKLALALVFVILGWRVLGAVGGFIGGITFGALVVLPAVLHRGPAQPYDKAAHDHLRLGGESLKVLAVTVGATALMLIDTVFAKHHLSGADAGYYGAAGTIARIVPYGVGLINLIMMPKAAAAHHAGREAVTRLLGLAYGAGALLTVTCVAALAFFPQVVIGASYGAKFAASIPILRLYAIDEGLFAICALGTAYLTAVREYRVAIFIGIAAAIEAALMAVYGVSWTRLLTIAIATNALLIPAVAYCVLHSLQSAKATPIAPQAPMPPVAEV
jgi:stage V sporulation protein B